MIGIADTGLLVAFANRRGEFLPCAHSLAVTVDGYFRVYRRNRRESIPVVMPPGL
jgi:hypothetical protein